MDPVNTVNLENQENIAKVENDFGTQIIDTDDIDLIWSHSTEDCVFCADRMEMRILLHYFCVFIWFMSGINYIRCVKIMVNGSIQHIISILMNKLQPSIF